MLCAAFHGSVTSHIRWACCHAPWLACGVPARDHNQSFVGIPSLFGNSKCIDPVGKAERFRPAKDLPLPTLAGQPHSWSRKDCKRSLAHTLLPRSKILVVANHCVPKHLHDWNCCETQNTPQRPAVVDQALLQRSPHLSPHQRHHWWSGKNRVRHIATLVGCHPGTRSLHHSRPPHQNPPRLRREGEWSPSDHTNFAFRRSSWEVTTKVRSELPPPISSTNTASRNSSFPHPISSEAPKFRHPPPGQRPSLNGCSAISVRWERQHSSSPEHSGVLSSNSSVIRPRMLPHPNTPPPCPPRGNRDLSSQESLHSNAGASRQSDHHPTWWAILPVT